MCALVRWPKSWLVFVLVKVADAACDHVHMHTMQTPSYFTARTTSTCLRPQPPRAPATSPCACPPGITQLSERVWYSNGTSTINSPSSVDATICTQAVANLTNHRNTFNSTLLRCVGEGSCVLAACRTCRVPLVPNPPA